MAVPHVAPLREAADAAALAERYRRVRARTVALAAPLSAEDAMVQSMPDASPAKWHLAHTTWFFEQFVLAGVGAAPRSSRWAALYNSYYDSVGQPFPRARRGLVSRPSLAEVGAYREQVDAGLLDGLVRGRFDGTALQVIALGLHHEQQHQELLLTDIKHALWCNPLRPAYREDLPRTPAAPPPAGWIDYGEAVVEIGAPAWPQASADFAYDNESPRHRVLVLPYRLARHPVTNGEYAAFVRDGGYARSELWLSDGWQRAREEAWTRPLYWDEALEHEFTLAGMRPIDPNAPVCHLSHYEADAYARWAGARLPTEAEWERAAAAGPQPGDVFVEDAVLHPVGSGASPRAAAPVGLFGDVWEWTASAYTAHPGYRPWEGSLGEYNGKFMSGTWVLRGGSCASPRDHLRPSYRNFFAPWARWQFSGLRLAREAA